MLADHSGSLIHRILRLSADLLIIWGLRLSQLHTFLVLDLALDVVNCVRALHFQGDGLSSEGLDKDLHATT